MKTVKKYDLFILLAVMLATWFLLAWTYTPTPVEMLVGK